MYNKFAIIFSVVLFIAGCATPAENKGGFLTGRETFEVAPVRNKTGKPFNSGLAAELARHIESSLIQGGFSMTKTSANAIMIEGNLTLYEKTGRSVRYKVESKLTDKTTQEVLGDIVTGRTVDIGGLMSTEPEVEQAVLDMVADDIVLGVEARIRR